MSGVGWWSLYRGESCARVCRASHSPRTAIHLTMSRRVPIFAFTLFILAPSLAQAQDQAVSSPCARETDEFKEQTTTRCEPLSVEIEDQPGETIYRARLIVSEVDGQPFLVLYTASDSWNFLDVDTAYALIDGENYRFRFLDVDREVDSGEVMEQNAMVVEAPAFEALGSASTIRLKIGQAVLRLPAEELGTQVRALRGL